MLNRLRLIAAAAVLIIAAPLAAVGTIGTANAEQAAAQAKPSRTIALQGAEAREGVFVAKGRVKPSYENRYAIMQRKVDDANKWSNWKKFKTNKDSRYRTRIAALNRVGIVCYRVKIKGSGKFKTSFSKPRRTVCVRTRRG